MATHLDVGVVDGATAQERFAQLARAGSPFNPVGGEEIGGANRQRLLAAMKSLRWADPRFVTREQAELNSWAVEPSSISVQAIMRDDVIGTICKVALFNAANVLGMPSMAAMLAMTDEEMAVMRGDAPKADVEVDDDLSIGPARTIAPDIGDDAKLNVIEADMDWLPRRFDGENYRDIKATYHSMMGIPENELFEGVAREAVGGDINAIRQITDKNERYFAAVSMGWCATNQATYQSELIRQAPEIAEEVAAVTKHNERRITAQTAMDLSARGAGGVEAESAVDLSKTAVLGQVGQGGDAAGAAIKGSAQGDDDFAVMAAYWQNGLHNPKGVALAKEINKAILDNKLGKDREAITRLMEVYPNARRLGIEIVTERQYLSDPHLRANVAEPKTLLGGALVRDKAGDYRPAAGGLPVLQDEGDSVTLKSKSADGYRAAMELALAKGWTAIELKGKPAMLANAWLEAKMLGLDVVNYAPTEKDKLKYAERVAEASKAKAAAVEAEQARAAAEGPEMVEVRPYVGADGLVKTATATVTVAQEHGSNAVGEPVVGPAVVRTVVRAGDVVESDVGQVAGVDVGSAAHQVADNIVEAELGQAIAAVTEGEHVGPIVEIKDGFIGQKIGRDPKEIRWHDASKFAGRVPALGEKAEISYSKGVAKLKEREKAQEVDR